MRQALQLTFDPECPRCNGGLVSGYVAALSLCFRCVKPGVVEPRLPCPNCGGLAIREGRCVGCDEERPE